MTPDIRPPDRDEPAVRSPELLRFVAAAKAATPPATRATADAVFAGFEARRRSHRRVGIGLAVAAAAVLALVWARPSFMSQRTGPKGPVDSTLAAATAPNVPELASAVRVTVAEGPAPAVRGAWELELAPGRYELEVAEHPGPELLRARTPSGHLELSHGFVTLIVAGDRTEAVLRTGVARWVAGDGTRQELSPPVPADSIDPNAGPAELARRADALLAEGRRDAAIRVLDRLVTGFPADPAARTALLDLGRLLRSEQRTDEARCAHALYLERYPGKAQLADEVAEALARLGPGPACDGLRPR
jgi:hypothetical protein